MKPRVIFLLNSVYANRGGLTHASLRQASTFAEAGYDAQILTFNYEPRFPVICTRLVQLRKVSDKVTIRNMFADPVNYTSSDKNPNHSFEENKTRDETFNDKSGSSKISQLFRIVRNAKVLADSGDDETLRKLHWLDNVINERDSEAFIVSDTRTTDELLVNLDNPLAKRALRPHSNHLRNPDDPDSELNKRNRYAIENISNIDALIVLTENQRNDIVNRFGHKDKVFTIPNHYEVKAPKIRGIRSLTANIKRLRAPSRDMTKVVVVTRFSSIKNIGHTIRAFKEVIEEIPSAKLEIWGSGKEKKKYIELIDELHLQDNVKVKGYTQHPEKVYQSAALSVVTSKAEGFSLSVMESMANGTPVVSYDIRYGPSDMIEDGVDGYLIKKGDIESLTKRMVHMLKNPDETRKMGEEARNTMRVKFGKENYNRLWFSLVDRLLENNH